MSRTDVVYYYDGSFYGFLTGVFDAFDLKEEPALFLSQEEEEQPLLFESHFVKTDPQKARRVLAGVQRTLGDRGVDIVREGFLTCLPHREYLLLKFLRQGFREGPQLLAQLTREPLCTLLSAIRKAKNEAHLLTGFIRFSRCETGVYVSRIRPHNQVLPLISHHFCTRYFFQPFLIWDITHRMVLLYQPKKRPCILPLDSLELPAPSPEEEEIQNMWRAFYNTLAIPARENPRCRMTHMPKRFWEFLTELTPPSAKKEEKALTFFNEMVQ